jgi:hypothetical protein
MIEKYKESRMYLSKLSEINANDEWILKTLYQDVMFISDGESRYRSS